MPAGHEVRPDYPCIKTLTLWTLSAGRCASKERQKPILAFTRSPRGPDKGIREMEWERQEALEDKGRGRNHGDKKSSRFPTVRKKE